MLITMILTDSEESGLLALSIKDADRMCFYQSCGKRPSHDFVSDCLCSFMKDREPKGAGE